MRRRGSSSSPHGLTAADPPNAPQKPGASPPSMRGTTTGRGGVPVLRVVRAMLTHNIGDPARTGIPGRRLFPHCEVQMKPSVLLRVASVLTLIFCAGHTYGALGSSSADPEQAAVFMAMQAFPFEIMGARRTHWQFYRGFSLLFSVTLLLLAVLLWQLAGLAKRDPAGARPLLASLFLAYLGFTILCGMYFFFAPAAFSAAVAICLALAFTSTRNT